MNQRPIYIEHPDLTKMRDDELENEATYLLNYGKTVCREVESGFVSMSNCLTTRPPVWKIIEDLNLAYNRFQAIIEEVQYRATQMR